MERQHTIRHSGECMLRGRYRRALTRRAECHAGISHIRMHHSADRNHKQILEVLLINCSAVAT